MVNICLIPVSIVLCLIVISLFHPQIMDPYVTYDGKAIKELEEADVIFD